ncbi:MAG: tRNA (adenosine(37)-N6)-threonylcarbamoyltransferase complex transferase subunit TsaD [Bacteroidota bacterium]
MSKDLILGIESSCDDTSVAVVDKDGNILSSVTSSQIEIHNQFGGIYPEFAARAHVYDILPTIHEAMNRADISPQRLKAIGVTRGPGLIGSLLVGLNTAAALGRGWDVPVLGINHLRGHLRSVDLEENRSLFPSMVLLVSGGHTLLCLMQSETDISIVGSTRDDSVGEAYDKVSRMLGLGYPGGPVVDRLAKEGEATIPFPRPMINSGFEFSFSGLKSAVSRYLQSGAEINKPNIAASFVDAVIEILIEKSRRALKKYPAKSLTIVGGVAASPQLREHAAKLTDELGIELCLPPIKWATDNGAMIAMAAWDYIHHDVYKPPTAQVELLVSDF